MHCVCQNTDLLYCVLCSFFCYISAEIDPLKLFVTGFEREMTEEQLRKLFPSANDVSLPVRKSDGKPVG